MLVRAGKWDADLVRDDLRAFVDEVYGDSPYLRAVLEKRQLGYVLAISSTHRVPAPAGPQRADHLVKHIPRRAWHKLSAGKGAKGHRWYH